MDSDFCVDALNDALYQYGKPGIFNTDQGSQFTSDYFTKLLEKNDIQISMDGKGRWVDNVFVERLWRSLKYEEVYPKCYDTVFEAKAGVSAWMNFYNQERLHQALNYKTPYEIYSARTQPQSSITDGVLDLTNLIQLDPK